MMKAWHVAVLAAMVGGMGLTSWGKDAGKPAAKAKPSAAAPAPPPVMIGEWAATGPVQAAAGTFSAEGDTPGLLQWGDTGSDDYFLTGQVLLPQATASVQIGLGKADVKTAVRNPSFAKIAWENPRGTDLLVFNNAWKTVPKLGELWVNFALRVIGSRAELEMMLPDYKAASLVAPADRRTVSLVLRGAKVRNLSLKRLPLMPALILPVTIDHAVNARIAGEDADAVLGAKLDSAGLPRGLKVIDGVPFCFADSADAQAIDVARLKQMVRKAGKDEPARSYPE